MIRRIIMWVIHSWRISQLKKECFRINNQLDLEDPKIGERTEAVKSIQKGIKLLGIIEFIQYMENERIYMSKPVYNECKTKLKGICHG